MAVGSKEPLVYYTIRFALAIYVLVTNCLTPPLNLNRGRNGEVEITLEFFESLHRKSLCKAIGELIFA